MRHDVRKRPKPEWIKAGITMVSMQEPLAFLRRAGMVGVDPHDDHFARYSEECVKKWRDEGVNLVVVSGQKGAGFRAEAENIEASKRMAEMCHKHGLYVGTYIGDTLLTETLFDEFPDARDWVQVDAYGTPVYYAATQTFRQKGCRSNAGYLGFLKEATRRCIEDIGVDFLHYDNFFTRGEPYTCHCDFCRAGLRASIRGKYSDEELIDRFGFADVSLIETPKIWPGQEPWRWGTIRDPLIQEWIDFHCQSLADAYGTLADYARSLKPDVVVECNPYGLGSSNNFLRLCVDHARQLPHGDVFWSEEHEYPQIRPDGEMWTKIRSYKLARTLDQVMFTYVKPYQDRGPALMSVCEALAFNQQTLHSPPPEHGRVRTLYDFRKANEDLYLDTETIADAAVFRQFHTLAYHPDEPRRAVQMTEQTLIQAHVPFDLIFDQQLDAADQYRVLIMPDVRCLSDEQTDTIREMVRNGLGLVATGQTSLCNHWARPRDQLALSDLFGVASADRAAWGTARRTTFGEGRVVYLPKLTPEQPLRQVGSDEGFLHLDIHRLPANWRELAEAIAWAAKGLTIEVEAPPTVACEFLRQPTTGRILVHLVNYDPMKEVEGICVRVSPGLVGDKEAARFVSPDPGAAEAAVEVDGQVMTVTVPCLEAYGIVVVE